MRNLLPFIPSEFFLVLLTGAGLVMIIGQRQWAQTLIVVVLAGAFLPVLAEPLFDALPPWALVLLIAVALIGIARLVLSLLLGRAAAEHAIGSVAAHALLVVLLAPFHFACWVGRMLLGRR